MICLVLVGFSFERKKLFLFYHPQNDPIIILIHFKLYDAQNCSKNVLEMSMFKTRKNDFYFKLISGTVFECISMILFENSLTSPYAENEFMQNDKS